MIESENQDEVQDQLVARLRQAGVTDDVSHAIAEGALEAWAGPGRAPPSEPGKLRAVVKRRRWVIKDEDLALLDVGGKTLLGLFQAGLIGAVVATPAAVGIGLVTLSVEVFKLAKRMQDKGVVLDQETFEVLVALRASESPLTTEELAKRLGHKGLRGALVDVTPQRVETLLNKLTKTVVNDGSTKAFVVQENGLWRVAGV